MYTFLFALLLFAPVAAILSTLVYAVCMVRRGMSARRAVLRQFCAFLVVGVLCCAGAVGISAAGPDTAEVSDARPLRRMMDLPRVWRISAPRS